MKRWFLAGVLLAGCTLTRIELADGTRIEAALFGAGSVTCCCRPVEPPWAPEWGCVVVKGGDIGTGSLGVIGMLGSAYLASQTGGLF